MAARTRQSTLVELLLIASVGFVAVLVVAWMRMPDVERGVRTVASDLALRLGFEE